MQQLDRIKAAIARAGYSIISLPSAQETWEVFGSGVRASVFRSGNQLCSDHPAIAKIIDREINKPQLFPIGDKK
ncbi:MAG TPA: hypothetical protein V6C65_16220 [Allocoleopsis sp.]